MHNTHLHIIHDCFPELDCDATANELQSQLNTLVNLNYDAMALSLFSQSIITKRQSHFLVHWTTLETSSWSKSTSAGHMISL